MQRKSLAWFLALAAVFAGIEGNLSICWNEWQFYKGVSALPPGSEIRLIGRGIDDLAISIFTLILTTPLAGAGIYFSIKQRRLAVGLLAFIGIILAISPLPLAWWLESMIIADAGISLAP